MENKDFSDIGEQIRRTVESALGSCDFEQLNKNISDSVNSALDDVRKSFLNTDASRKKASEDKAPPPDRQTDSGTRKAYHNDSLDQSYPRHQAVDKDTLYGGNDIFDNISRYVRVRGVNVKNDKGAGAPEGSHLPDSVRVNYPGKVSGILYTVFGSIGVGVTALLAVIMLFVSLLVKPVFGFAPGGAVFFLVLGGIFAIMLGTGQKRLGKIKRLKTYLRECGDKTYCQTEQLAASVGKPQRFVIKDLERLIRDGVLPEARLDEKKTCLMLDKPTYRQYLDTQKSFAERKRLEAEAAAGKQKEAADKNSTLSAEVKQMVSMGREYLKTLREANQAIPGEEISQKLTKLEHVIDRIFETVEKHPEQARGMERFMDYYLPTTVKLVNAYRDFDAVGMEAGNTASAKKEIENTLDTIIKAFERLLDDLYADAALDVSTDASVLQTMLRQDGFGDSDFKKGEE